ncbi:MAG: crossover junction endodeoxyribonuclease RuvC [Ignavibacteriaceae bacterium]|nr:crossover junction endodeoxyribonuclease RuvC [Ignavibacteriaceae bacterium]
MMVIGIDPGSVKTGYGIVRSEGDTFSLVSCGVIRLSSRQCIPERIKIIYDTLEALIAQHRPARLAIETAYVNRNAQSALKLGQVRGAIVALAMNTGIGLHEYAPREVKKMLTGRGAASKDQVAYMARHFLNVVEPIKPHDITDALGIALCDLIYEGKEGTGKTAGTVSSSRGNSWAVFVKDNPDLVL